MNPTWLYYQYNILPILSAKVKWDIYFLTRKMF